MSRMELARSLQKVLEEVAQIQSDVALRCPELVAAGVVALQDAAERFGRAALEEVDFFAKAEASWVPTPEEQARAYEEADGE